MRTFKSHYCFRSRSIGNYKCSKNIVPQEKTLSKTQVQYVPPYMNTLYTRASYGSFSKLLKQVLLLTPFRVALANGLQYFKPMKYWNKHYKHKYYNKYWNIILRVRKNNFSFSVSVPRKYRSSLINLRGSRWEIKTYTENKKPLKI